MSERDYNKIGSELWLSPRFRGLSEAGKTAFLYIMTNRHVPSIGCYYLPEGYACTDLEWPAEKYAGVRDELIAAGLIDYDPDAEEVFIERWVKHNPLTNSKHATGAFKRIEHLRSDKIREKALAAFTADKERMDEQLRQKEAQKAMRSSTFAAQDQTRAYLLSSRLMNRG